MPEDTDTGGPFEMVEIEAPDGNPTIQPLEVDEKDMPLERARLWTINGTERSIDVYANYADQPLATDIEATSIGSAIDISGEGDRPYGTYTLAARDAGEPDGDVLASASVPVDEGDSYSAVLHRAGEFDYQMSIYRNDYSPSQDARVVVRHCAYPETIDWGFFENGETPRIPDDPRSGTLSRGQWQEATDVTEQDYLFQVLVDGEVAAFDANYEFEVETTYVVYVVGDPEPLFLPDEPPYEESQDSGIDESQWLLLHAFEVFPGADQADTVTPPTEPVSTTDTNAAIEFDCEALRLYETNRLETEVRATDPDGIVTGLAIDAVDPPTDGVTVVDNSVDRAFHPGGTTTATLRVAPDVPPDRYEVRVIANPESLAQSATCTIPVVVDPIPVARLYDLVDRYQLSGDIDQGIATDLNVLLDDAAAHVAADKTSQGCAALKDVVTLLGDNKDVGVSETAHDDLQTETEALRTRLDCG